MGHRCTAESLVVSRFLLKLTLVCRFYCAKSAEKVKLDFGEKRCIWSGKDIHRIIKGDSVLYIFSEVCVTQTLQQVAKSYVILCVTLLCI